ncbi:Homeobox protein Wariai (Homeobox protein 1) (DdHbx-1) [Durusdinium trenchii]|uniref:Homeobox protein Wariai (Homeobox protein 1) (DdHbx-1) n=1 Tax=Durusdinium trenchii TaxID=1381693 RepID=A0ABP0JUX7_9DINO
MGGCQSNVVYQEIEPFIAMWVLKVSDFVKMQLPLPKHEELAEMGLLHRRVVSHYCIFVSHQWLSTMHPDPEGDQLRVLQRSLVEICEGRITVTNDAASQFFGEVKTLSNSQRAKIRDAVLWIDWASIPQVETFRDEDEDDEVSLEKRQRATRTFVYRSPARPRRLSEQEEFILSLPSFVQASQVFVALVPPLRHHDTGEMCNHASWITRGWCRTELFCNMMLGNQDMPNVIVTASDVAHFARPVNWVDCLPHEGEFSYPGDKPVVKSIFEQALSHQLRWLEGEGHMDLYRYFLARREVMCGIRPVRRTIEQFLEDFGYESLKKSKASSLGPVVCAALAGDAELLKSLLEACCPVDKPVKGMPEIGVVRGLTPLHLTALQGWRSPKVLELLLEARSDPNLSASGVPPLACCRTARDVQILLNFRADLNGQYAPLHVSPLALASGEPTKPEVIAKLLESRASPNGPLRARGLSFPHALCFVAMNALSIAKLLVEAEADINAQSTAGGIFRAAELFSRAYLQFGRPSSILMVGMAEQTTTVLGFACLFSATELVEFLLNAKGDLHVKNSRGHRPIDLIRSRDILRVVRDCEALQAEDWRPENWEAPKEDHSAGTTLLTSTSYHASPLQTVSLRTSSCSSQSSERSSTT